MAHRLPLLLTALALLTLTLPALAHEGGGEEEHLRIGFYYGHDGSYEAPADPPGPATLLVDTHPWELHNVFYELAPGLGGVYSLTPGFRPLDVEDEEYGGHGFYTWLNDAHGFGTPDLYLHLDDIDPRLQVLDPGTTAPATMPFHLGANAVNHHLIFFVADADLPAPGEILTATFHLSDAAGIFADSEPFTLQFRLVPEPASVSLLIAGAAAITLRRRH